MIYVVGKDYGPYDGGFIVKYISTDIAKAAIWLAEHNDISMKLVKVPMDTEMDGIDQFC